MAVMASDWPLLAGGRYSEVAVRTGLTVFKKFLSLELQFIAIKWFIFKLTRTFEELTFDFRAIQNRGTRFRC